jgi:hypothetical protein
LRNFIKKFGALGEWATAAEKFVDYWNGAGTWRKMSLDRRVAFSEALKPNFFECDAVMNESMPRRAMGRPTGTDVVSMRSLHGFANPRDHGNRVGPVAVGPTRRCLEPVTWPRSRARTWSIRWSPLFWGLPANNQTVITVCSGQAPNMLEQAWLIASMDQTD